MTTQTKRQKLCPRCGGRKGLLDADHAEEATCTCTPGVTDGPSTAIQRAVAWVENKSMAPLFVVAGALLFAVVAAVVVWKFTP